MCHKNRETLESFWQQNVGIIQLALALKVLVVSKRPSMSKWVVLMYVSFKKMPVMITKQLTFIPVLVRFLTTN